MNEENLVIKESHQLVNPSPADSLAQKIATRQKAKKEKEKLAKVEESKLLYNEALVSLANHWFGAPLCKELAYDKNLNPAELSASYLRKSPRLFGSSREEES